MNGRSKNPVMFNLQGYLVFSKCRNLKETGSNVSEGILASKRESKQAESKLPSSMCFIEAGSRRGGLDEHLDHKWAFPHHMIYLRQRLPSELCPANWVSVDSRCGQADNPEQAYAGDTPGLPCVSRVPASALQITKGCRAPEPLHSSTARSRA